jgi:hypothetical protein
MHVNTIMESRDATFFRYIFYERLCIALLDFLLR